MITWKRKKAREAVDAICGFFCVTRPPAADLRLRVLTNRATITQGSARASLHHWAKLRRPLRGLKANQDQLVGGGK